MAPAEDRTFARLVHAVIAGFRRVPSCSLPPIAAASRTRVLPLSPYRPTPAAPPSEAACR
jgi:hypothetical protein